MVWIIKSQQDHTQYLPKIIYIVVWLFCLFLSLSHILVMILKMFNHLVIFEMKSVGVILCIRRVAKLFPYNPIEHTHGALNCTRFITDNGMDKAIAGHLSLSNWAWWEFLPTRKGHLTTCQGLLYSLSHETINHQIAWNLEAAIYDYSFLIDVSRTSRQQCQISERYNYF